MTIVATADGSNVSVAYQVETALATTPGSPHLTKVRHTGCNFDVNFEAQDNNEVTDTKQVYGSDLVAVGVTGTLPFNYLIGEYDNFEKAAILAGAATTSTITGVSNVAFTAASKTITLSGAAAGGFANALPGSVIKITGAGSATNNGYKTVETKTDSSTITVVETLADAATDSPVIKLNHISNGTTRTSMLFEMQYNDLSSEFRLVQGVVPTGLNLSFDKKSLANGNFPLLAVIEAPASATIETSTYAAASNVEPVNSSNMLSNVRIRPYNSNGTHGTQITAVLAKAALTVTNGARVVDAVGEGLYPINIQTGPVAVSVSCTAYFQSKALFEAALNSTAVSFSFQVIDRAGNAKFYTVPKGNVRNVKYNSPANASDCIVDFTIEGRIDDYVTNKSIIISTHMAA